MLLTIRRVEVAELMPVWLQCKNQNVFRMVAWSWSVRQNGAMKSATTDDEERGEPLEDWPFAAFMPPGQREAWLTATPHQRSAMERRFAAITDWMSFGRFVPDEDKTRLARLADLEPFSLRNLVSRFRNTPVERRSLSMLGIRTEPRPNAGWKRNDELRRHAASVIERLDKGQGLDSPSTVASVIDRAMEDPRLAEGPDRRAMLRKLVVEGRRRRSSARRFGSAVAIDDLELAAISPAGGRYRVAAVIDVGTGLVMGFALANGPPGTATVRDAIGGAAAWLESTSLPGMRAATGPVDFTVALPQTEATQVLRLFGALRDWAPRREVRGRLAMSAIGPRLGRLGIRAGLDRNAEGRDEDLPIIPVDDVCGLIAAGMESRRAELVGAGGETRAVRARRLEIAAALRLAAAAIR